MRLGRGAHIYLCIYVYIYIYEHVFLFFGEPSDWLPFSNVEGGKLCKTIGLLAYPVVIFGEISKVHNLYINKSLDKFGFQFLAKFM